MPYEVKIILDSVSPDGADRQHFMVNKLQEVFKELQTVEEFKGGRIGLDFSADNKKNVRLLVNA
jgi:hypothetical protein